MKTNNSLNFHEKILRFVKENKKKTSLHALYGLFLCLLLILAINILGKEDSLSTLNQSLKNEDELTMTFTGDIMMGRNVLNVVEEKGYNYPFENIQPFFNNSDLVTSNFENPVVLDNKYAKEEENIHFKTNEQAANELLHQKFDVVNLANNHAMDYEEQGMKDTIHTFDNLDLDIVGAGENIDDAAKIAYKEVNGYKIAVLGFTDFYGNGDRATPNSPGVLPANPQHYIPLVHEANRKADIVLVHLHWGQEYDSLPLTRQKEMGRNIIDAGADVIVGAHPHVLQPIDFYKKGVIFNSLGNFIFDQGWSRPSETAIAQYRIDDGDAKVDVYPMQIKGAQPTLVQGKLGSYRKYKIYSSITNGMPYSKEWKKDWEVQENHITHTIQDVN